MLLTNQKTINYEKFTLLKEDVMSPPFFASAKVVSLNANLFVKFSL